MQVARPWLCCCAMSGMFVACLYMLPKSIRALHRDSTEQVCYTQTTRTPQHARTRDGHSSTLKLLTSPASPANHMQALPGAYSGECT